MSKNKTGHDLSWEQVATAWKQNEDRLLRPRDGLNLRLIELTKVSRNSRLLDFGTGVGVPGLTAAQETGCEVHGVDVAEAMLKIAEDRRVKAGAQNFFPRHLSGPQLPFDNEFFDAAISSFALEFSPQVENDIREIHRVLKPNGLLVVSNWIRSVEENPFQSYLPEEIRRALGPVPMAHDPFFKFADSEALIELMAKNQMKIQATETFKGALQYDSVDEFWILKKLASPAVSKDLSLLSQSQLQRLEAKTQEKFQKLSSNGKVLVGFACFVHVFKK